MEQVLMTNGKIKIINTKEGKRLENKVGNTNHFIELTHNDWLDLRSFFIDLIIEEYKARHFHESKEGWYRVDGQGD